jgi:diaminohydroxyphosphoribosylaminopyrimidine deaminase/5-amino-6-(5-phosphoribosylamino)uracil reductase
MLEALKESFSGIGLTSPNPSVGCVLVDREGKEISRGHTQPFPGIHAERSAFSKITDPARLDGATAYVTLEPCSHFGNQPPCADLIVNSKIHRVVIARHDPNPIINGKGIQKLLHSGKLVETGLFSSEATAWNLGFFAYQTLKRPVLFLKWAQTLDGQLADDLGNSKWITGPAARAYTHWLRQKYDCILVGANTVLKDFPRLDVRDCAPPRQCQPLPIIFDPKGILLQLGSDDQEKLLKTTFHPDRPFVFVSLSDTLKSNSESWLHQQTQASLIALKGDDVITELVQSFQDKMIENLLGHRLQTVFVEGGPRLLTGLIEAGFGDVFHIFTAPILMGGKSNRIQIARKLNDALQLRLISTAQLGNDVLTEMLRSEIVNPVGIQRA